MTVFKTETYRLQVLYVAHHLNLNEPNCVQIHINKYYDVTVTDDTRTRTERQTQSFVHVYIKVVYHGRVF